MHVYDARLQQENSKSLQDSHLVPHEVEYRTCKGDIRKIAG